MALHLTEGEHLQGLPREERSPADLLDYSQAVQSTLALKQVKFFNMVLLHENNIFELLTSFPLSMFCLYGVKNISDIWDIPGVVLGSEMRPPETHSC